MKRILKFIVIGLAVLILTAQFIRPDFTNPPVVEADKLETITDPPEEVRALLRRSCMDCHSNETAYPWYSNVTPFSWFLAGHIADARAELNFSEWGTYNERTRERMLEEICDSVRSGEMPLPSYLWVHRDAILEKGEIEILCSWTGAAANIRQ